MSSEDSVLGEPVTVSASPGGFRGLKRKRRQVRRDRTNVGSYFGIIRQSWLASLSLVYLAIVAVSAVIGPLTLQTEATNQELLRRLEPPFHSSNGVLYFLGSDSLGRSELARLIVGSEKTLLVVLGAVAASAIAGFWIGITAGYHGGWIDSTLMRLGDILMTVPSLLLAVAVLVVFPNSVYALIFVLALTALPVIIRATRAQALEIKERTCIEAARAMGERTTGLLVRQMAPLIIPTLMTIVILNVAVIMLEVAGLSYLGVGLQPPAVTWGQMVADGQPYLSTAWWLTVFPGLAITLCALALSIVSNVLRAATDPLQAGALRKGDKDHAPDAQDVASAFVESNL